LSALLWLTFWIQVQNIISAFTACHNNAGYRHHFGNDQLNTDLPITIIPMGMKTVRRNDNENGDNLGGFKLGCLIAF
jgi:hypothetical protein